MEQGGIVQVSHAECDFESDAELSLGVFQARRLVDEIKQIAAALSRASSERRRMNQLQAHHEFGHDAEMGRVCACSKKLHKMWEPKLAAQIDLSWEENEGR